MANSKSAIKYIRKTATRTSSNRLVTSRLKTLSKRVRTLADDPAKVKVAAVEYVSALDKAAKSGVIHANKASRGKASVAKYIYAAS